MSLQIGKNIPKYIYQLLPDKNNIDALCMKNIQFIKSLNSTWTHVLFDDDDMIKYVSLNYPELIDVYLSINPEYGAARADFFRYLLMYREGGAYFDIKSCMRIPLDKILKDDDEYILAHWGKGGEYHAQAIGNKEGEFQQWHIICRPNHPFLLAVIQKVIDNIKDYDLRNIGTGKLGVLKTTGPIAYSIAILPLLDKYKHRCCISDEEIHLIYHNLNVFSSESYSAIKYNNKPHYSTMRTPIILRKNKLKYKIFVFFVYFINRIFSKEFC